MDNNKFEISIVPDIPENKVPGTIYIKRSRYADRLPLSSLIRDRHGYKFEDDDSGKPKRFLLVGKPKTPADYLGLGVDKEVVASVNDDTYIDSNKIFITPNHPGFTIPEPSQPSRYYLDSSSQKLYKPVENPRVNGYRVLQYLKEQTVVYVENITSPVVYVYADYIDTEEIEGVQVMYNSIYPYGDGDSADTYLPTNIIIVHSEEELHSLTPSFMGIYKVEREDGTYTPYIYNPYDLVNQEYFNFNCDVIY